MKNSIRFLNLSAKTLITYALTLSKQEELGFSQNQK